MPVPLEICRGRLLAVLLALAVTGSEPLGKISPYAAYTLLVLAAAVVWRAPMGRVLKRLLLLSPALLLLSLGLPLSRMADRFLGGEAAAIALYPAPQEMLAAASLLLRALCAAGLLIVLAESLGWRGILRGLRGLRLPLAVTAVLEHLERYRALVAEEWRRTSFAREARSPGGRRFALASYAGQTGMVFLRGWDRSERIHQAMLSRGYSLGAPPSTVGLERAGARAVVLGWLQPLWLPALALAIRIAL